MVPLVVSIGNIISTCLTCHLLRVVSRLLFPERLCNLAEEFLSTLDFCSCCFELAFICDTYGTIVFAVALFVMCFWWSITFGDAAANPNKHLEDIAKGDVSVSDAGFRILAEIAAGAIVVRYMKYVWAMGYSDVHGKKALENICYADLQVSVMQGALVEGIITFIDRLNALTLEETNWSHSTFTSSLLSTGLVVSALNYSGGYFNPVLATSLKLGCKGHSVAEFLTVYWLASIIGSLTALTVHRVIGLHRFIGIHSKQLKRD